MKVTLTAIKAEVGSVEGHIRPSAELLVAVKETIREGGKGLIIDHALTPTGDDVAILFTHNRGMDCEAVDEPAWDAFDHPYWDWVREKASRKAHHIREQRFSGPAMLGYHELEYGGITKRVEHLDERFTIREGS